MNASLYDADVLEYTEIAMLPCWKMYHRASTCASPSSFPCYLVIHMFQIVYHYTALDVALVDHCISFFRLQQAILFICGTSEESPSIS